MMADRARRVWFVLAPLALAITACSDGAGPSAGAPTTASAPGAPRLAPPGTDGGQDPDDPAPASSLESAEVGALCDLVLDFRDAEEEFDSISEDDAEYYDLLYERVDLLERISDFSSYQELRASTLALLDPVAGAAAPLDYADELETFGDQAASICF